MYSPFSVPVLVLFGTRIPLLCIWLSYGPPVGIEYHDSLSYVRAGLRGQATFARQDLWKSDMSKYDNVVIFGVEQMMAQLEEKLEKELKGGSTVVACRSRH